MLTITCHFQFPDGVTALASASAPSPHSDVEVKYAGDFERLPDRLPLRHVSVIKIWAERVAEAAGAKLSISETGLYDWWAR